MSIPVDSLVNPSPPMLKPLFVPLKSEYFDAFAVGSKQTEYRAHGPRWNRRTCPQGRPVVLSRGYGKSHRLVTSILSVEVMPRKRAPEVWRRIYPEAAECIAIHMTECLPETKGTQP